MQRRWYSDVVESPGGCPIGFVFHQPVKFGRFGGESFCFPFQRKLMHHCSNVRVSRVVFGELVHGVDGREVAALVVVQQRCDQRTLHPDVVIHGLHGAFKVVEGLLAPSHHPQASDSPRYMVR